MYTNAFPSNNGNNDSYTQVIEWTKYVSVTPISCALVSCLSIASWVATPSA